MGYLYTMYIHIHIHIPTGGGGVLRGVLYRPITMAGGAPGNAGKCQPQMVLLVSPVEPTEEMSGSFGDSRRARFQ